MKMGHAAFTLDVLHPLKPHWILSELILQVCLALNRFLILNQGFP